MKLLTNFFIQKLGSTPASGITGTILIIRLVYFRNYFSFLRDSIRFFFQKLYYKYSKFLPYVNNETNSTNWATFKEGITKLKRLVLVGGPDDGVITPWQSSHFGYYDTNETVVEMRNRPIYKDDMIGLKTLDGSGRLTLITVPNVPHVEWHKNVSIVDEFLLPYLD